MRKLGFIIGIIVLLMAVMPVSNGLPVQAQPGWYWKAGNFTDYAMSGMPDFDQKQDAWTNPVTGNWSYCGPVAVANSLWWFDSKNEPSPVPPPTINDHYGLVTNFSNPWDDHSASNVMPLVNNLSYLMDTDGQRTGIPHSGTNVTDMQWGIDKYLINTGYYGYYYERTMPWPQFGWIEEEVERCEDVVLLLGFYYNNSGYYERIGGHYVTCAGVNSGGLQIGISDPYYDNAEAGGPGVVPVPHAKPHGSMVHNNATLVSHDIYNVTQLIPGPGGLPCWALQNYTVGKDITNFTGQNGGGFWIAGPVETIIDYAVDVSPKPDLNGDIDSDYELTAENVSIRVHVTNETLDNMIYDMDVLFWTEAYGTEWNHMVFAEPLKFCQNYTFNVTYVVPPEKVVLHFSNETHANIGFAFSEEALPPGWYWKPGNWTDYALSGMPDFDQKQDMWRNPPVGGNWTYCGPVAVANSLWWFDSKNEPSPVPPPTINDHYGLVTNFSNPWDDHNASNVMPLVNNLSLLMNTSSSGTDVMDMQAGINQYLNATVYAAAYNETTVKGPNFSWIEEEVERCEDVVLLLGFWQYEWVGPGPDDYYWWRIGGHYVTCAGVNSTNPTGLQIGISDPYFDNAEAGGPGVIPVPHPAHPGDATVHNDTKYVSHDIYNVIQFIPGPGFPPYWALPNYAVGKPIVNFLGQNSGPGLIPPGVYNPELPVVTVIDYAVAVSPTAGATLQGHVDLQARPIPPNAQWVVPVTVRFFQGGSETVWSPVNVTTDQNGNFSVPGFANGTYDIGVKSPLTTSRLKSGIGVAGITSVYFGTLLSGDVNSDDYIGLDDYTKTVTAYDSVPGSGNWNDCCDFNRDSYVGLDDYTLSVTNYDKVGEMYGM